MSSRRPSTLLIHAYSVAYAAQIYPRLRNGACDVLVVPPGSRTRRLADPVPQTTQARIRHQ